MVHYSLRGNTLISDFSLPSSENINFTSFKTLNCGNLLGQSQEANTEGKKNEYLLKGLLHTRFVLSTLGVIYPYFTSQKKRAQKDKIESSCFKNILSFCFYLRNSVDCLRNLFCGPPSDWALNCDGSSRLEWLKM